MEIFSKGYNCKINKVIVTQQFWKQIWKFLEKIKSEQTDFERLEKGVLMWSRRNKKAIERDLAIEKAKTSYLDPNSEKDFKNRNSFSGKKEVWTIVYVSSVNIFWKAFTDAYFIRFEIDL